MTTASTTGEGRARLDFDLGDDEPVISPEATHQKIQEISEKAGFNARAPQRSSVKPEVANIHKPEVLPERRRGRRTKTGRTPCSTPKSDLKPMKRSARFQTRPRRGKAAP